MFIHVYKVFVSHVKLCSWADGSNQLNTGGGGRNHLPPVSTQGSKLAFRAGFFYPFNRATLVGVPCMGDARSSQGISVQGEISTPEINAQASAPISHPQSYELAISRLKRGGVEVIMVGHIF